MLFIYKKNSDTLRSKQNFGLEKFLKVLGKSKFFNCELIFLYNKREWGCFEVSDMRIYVLILFLFDYYFMTKF